MVAAERERLVSRWILTRGHRLPTGWDPARAVTLLRHLMGALPDPVNGQWSSEQYEAALETLCDLGVHTLDTVIATGPLLEQFADYLVERRLLETNPHRPADPAPGAHSSSPAQTPTAESAPQCTWDIWDELEEAFFRDHETGHCRFEGSTPENYRCDLRLAREYFRTHHQSLDNDALKAFVRWLEKEARTKTGQPYACSSIVRKKNALRAFLRSPGAQKAWPGLDLSILASKRRDKTPTNPYPALTPNERTAFVKAAATLPLAQRVMVLLPLECGLRAADVAALRWTNVDFANGRLDYVAKKTGLRVHVPVPQHLFKLLSEYRVTCQSDLLFPGRERQSVSGKTVTEWVRKVATLARIWREVSAHDLRKTFATYQFYHCEVDLPRLQKWLGHGDINTTRGYVDDEANWHRRRAIREAAA